MEPAVGTPARKLGRTQSVATNDVEDAVTLPGLKATTVRSDSRKAKSRMMQE